MESKTDLAREDFDDRQIYQLLHERFQKYDVDNSGYIDSKEELLQLVTNIGFLCLTTFDMEISQNELDTFVSLHESSVTLGRGLSFEMFADLVIPAFKIPMSSFDDTRERRSLEAVVELSNVKPVSKHHISPKLRKSLHAYFKKYDLDDSGFIDDEQELKLLAVNTAFLASDLNIFVSQEDIDGFVEQQLPRMSCGGITFDEFVNIIVQDYGLVATEEETDKIVEPGVEACVVSCEEEDLAEEVSEEVSEDRTCGICLATNPIRAWCISVDDSPRFNLFINFCIAFVTICMALETPIWFPDGSTGAEFFRIADLVASIIFTIEMSIRITSRGFCRGRNTYLANPWCRLDFFIVVVGWLALAVALPNVKGGRALRALRMLRSLRTVRSLTSMRWCVAIMEALFDALPQVTHVCILILFMTVFYGIFGLQIFRGVLHQQCFKRGSNGTIGTLPDETYCSRDLYGTDNGLGTTCPINFECLTEGENPFQGHASFDNIGVGMVTIFQVTTLEGWCSLMYATEDSAGFVSIVYYISMVIFLTFMVINVFVAVICVTFSQTRQRHKKELYLELLELSSENTPDDDTIDDRIMQTKEVIDISDFHPKTREEMLRNEISGLECELEQLTEQMYPIQRQLMTNISTIDMRVKMELQQKLVHLEAETSNKTNRRKQAVIELKDLRARGSGMQAPETTFSRSADAGKRSVQRVPKHKHVSDLHYETRRSGPHTLEDAKELINKSRGLAGQGNQTHEGAGNGSGTGLSVGAIVVSDETSPISDGDAATPTSPLNPRPTTEQPAITDVELENVSLDAGVRTAEQTESSAKQSCCQRCRGYCCCRALAWIWVHDTPLGAQEKPVGKFISSNYFETFIMVCIMLNIGIMALQYYGQSEEEKEVLSYFNNFFSAVFMVEMILKWCGMGGLMYYFRDISNCFDFTLVMLSIFSFLGSSGGFSAFRGLRSLRIMRALRSLKALRSLRLLRTLERLYVSLASCAGAILAQLLFVVLTMSIFAIMGIQLFAGYDFVDADGETPRTNFNTFLNAFLTLFLILTAEGWNEVMYDGMRVSPVMSVLYCTIFFVLVNYALMEMLIAVMMENFEISDEQKINIQKAKCGLDIEDVDDSADVDMDHNPEVDKMALQDVLSRASSGHAIRAYSVLSYARRAAAYNEGNLMKACFFEWQIGCRLETLDLGYYSKKSMWCVTFQNPVRKLAVLAIEHPRFEFFVFVVICVSSVFLALDTPNPAYRPSWLDDFSAIADPIFVGIFVIEFLIKWLAMGFYGATGSFCSDSLNKFDLFVLVLSLFSMLLAALTGSSSPVGRALRALRAVRPLRMMNKTKQLRLVLEAIGEILPQVLNVLILILFTTFLFALVGLFQYMGSLYQCNNEDAQGKNTCVGEFVNKMDEHSSFPVPSVWANPPYSFDNIGAAIQLMIEVSSLEGWNTVMFQLMDIEGDDKQPQKNASPANCLFPILYVVITAFIFVSLMITLIIDQFNRTVGKGMLTEGQREFRAVINRALSAPRPQPILPPPKHQRFRVACYHLVGRPWWDKVSTGVVLLNVVVMMCNYYGESQQYKDDLDLANYLFSYIYLVELITVLSAFGWRQYLVDNFNVVDAACIILMVVSGTTCLICKANGWDAVLDAIDPVRQLVMVRLLKHTGDVRIILVTLAAALPAISNVIALMCITFFVYAVMGMQLFGNVKFGNALNSHANFQNFSEAFLLLIRIVTGEDWPALYHDCGLQPPHCTRDGTEDNPGDCGDPVMAVIYFNSFYLFGTYMVMNLFVAVICDTFSDCMHVAQAAVSAESIETFGKRWNHFTEDAQPAYKYLALFRLRQFMEELNLPLGVDPDDKSVETLKRYRMIYKECATDAEMLRFDNQRLIPVITYKRLLQILCLHAAGIDHMTEAEKMFREFSLDRIKRNEVISRLAARWRGHSTRKRLHENNAQKKNASAQNQLDSIACAVALDELDIDPKEYLQQRIEEFKSSGVFRQKQLLREIQISLGRPDPMRSPLAQI